VLAVVVGWALIAHAAAPSPPALVDPPNNATEVSFSPTLSTSVSDPDGTPLNVAFYGRPATGENFSVVVIPDTQFYSESYPLSFVDQTRWIVNSKDSANIAYVAHMGDIVNSSAVTTQWINADAAMDRLDDPVATGLPDGIPYGVVPGNHDQPTVNYNTYFGVARFSGRSYYGGHYGSDNDNNYTLFSAGAMDFIVINLEYPDSVAPDAAVLAWAGSLLKTYDHRQGIVVSHSIISTGNPGAFSDAGQAIFDALSGNSNLFLMLCGHVSGEGRRSDLGTNGNTVHTLLADYQSRPNGGDGWLRILEFAPAANEIRVKTYSPVLNQYETDANSQFTLPYEGFQLLGTNAGVPTESTTSITWPAPGLNPFTEYDWYVGVSDGGTTTKGPIWSFTTTGIAGDTDGDCDVDGTDLYELLTGAETMGLGVFAENFGKNDCL
jgi:hypothetical protein